MKWDVFNIDLMEQQRSLSVFKKKFSNDISSVFREGDSRNREYEWPYDDKFGDKLNPFIRRE